MTTALLCPLALNIELCRAKVVVVSGYLVFIITKPPIKKKHQHRPNKHKTPSRKRNQKTKSTNLDEQEF